MKLANDPRDATCDCATSVHGLCEVGRYCLMDRRRAGRTVCWTTTRGVTPHMRLDLGPSRNSLHVLEAEENRAWLWPRI